MLDSIGFDAWADEYDAAVERSETDGTYPFCGYREVHSRVYDLLKTKHSVLDLGVGTARLTSRLYDDGVQVCGVDFSKNMLSVARRKMPNARLLCADLKKGLPDSLDGMKFDAITAMYSIHHLTDGQKINVINSALRLTDGGIFVIGDVAFETEHDRAQCKAAAGETFDDAEFYCVYEKLAPNLSYPSRFERVSFCSGLIVIGDGV